VGAIVGNGFRKLGNEVIFYDVDKKRVEELGKSGLSSTTNMAEAVKKSDISFICVPTPTKGGKIDLSYVRAAAGGIGGSLRDKDGYHVVVVKSTVVPTTTEKIVIPILEKSSGKKVGKSFGVCMNPEFLTEIRESWTKDRKFSRDFFTEERIVIGEFDKKSGDVVEKLYRPLKLPIFRVDLRTAEMVKYASNCALASRISYWNEIYYICQKINVDSDLVARIAALDSRIGTYGIVHKKAFGGKCFPKDLAALIHFSRELGYDPKLLRAVEEINQRIGKERGVRE